MGSARHIIIGTRGSDLALWQANFTKKELEKNGYTSTLKIIKTQGDKIQDLSFDKLEGKGFFTKELEDALLNNEIDMAVHSCKDMPTENTPGLSIAGYSTRAAAGDVLLVRPAAFDPSKLLSLVPNVVVGTSSARRKAQLLSYRPDVALKDLRGNVPTRVKKLRDGEYDAIILAAAGLERLQIDLSKFKVVPLDPPLFIPAAAQGVLAWQTRENNDTAIAAIKKICDQHSYNITQIERGLLAAFKGGCQVPLGIYAAPGKTGNFDVWISWANAWDAPVKRIRTSVSQNFDPTHLVSNFRTDKPCSVFISREENGDTFFTILRANGYTVTGESFLEFVPLPFNLRESFEWIFFASKNGVDHFFSQVTSLSDGVKIAAINQGTARHIRQAGHNVDFEGKGQDLEAIGKELSAVIGKAKILFPQAQNSRRSIQQHLSPMQCIDLVVYNDTPKEKIHARKEDILVFTSPLNVHAYFKHNKLQAHQKLVSIGQSTYFALQTFGFESRVAHEPTPWCMADEVMGVGI